MTSRFANLISPNRVSPGLGGLVGYRPKRVSGLGLAGLVTDETLFGDMRFGEMLGNRTPVTAAVGKVIIGDYAKRPGDDFGHGTAL